MERGDGESGEEMQERLSTIAELKLAAEGGQAAHPGGTKGPHDDDEEEDVGFEEMGLDARLLRALSKKGLSYPTPVQAKAMPLILEGKDVVARAKTGSGKTLSYLLPLVHKLLAEGGSKKGPRAMVLVPTRELCQQVYDEATSLAEYCGATLRVVQLATTMSTATMKMSLARVPDILVATPARIAACISQNVIQPAVLEESLAMLVLDEADLLFSYGYEEDLRSLAVYVPRKCQCLLMSATASPDVDKLKKLVLHNPVTLTLTEEVDGSGDTSVVPKSVQQFSVHCKSKDKLLYMLSILKYDLIQKKAIIFVNTIDTGFRLKLFLEQFGIKSAVLNGELPQNSRLHILQQFNVGLFEHLIATDDGKSLQPVSSTSKESSSTKDSEAEPVESKSSKKAVRDTEFGVVRGIDFKNVRTVVNYDMPETVAGYIHRIGRTGRAGNAGISLSLVPPEDEEILKQIKVELSGVDEGQQNNKALISPFPLLSKTAVESLRYRAEDVMRSVTKIAVREARAKELRIEILNSERLKAHFEDNPTDLELLKHDKVLSKVAPAAHLKTVPEYLRDPTTEAASRAVNLARAAMNLAQSSFVKRKNKRVRVQDAPTAFTKSAKRLKRDGRKGGKSEDGKSRSRNASKHKRRKR
ncbi:DEAD-box ATP-dependent RNA helicase 16 [Physcomitrium patens]|uniref:RNA helicase n=1 Tax=Physcomitrium patens TaxID=3218 RepID=A0A7I3ZGN0_PHYPA|nr:DEAD-box ATP-dependent RNA helicase 16-like [Physcomitrium patens]|eukprot:XP_024367407.1 DEAD-box ATP-dependent RNA helicase 16-like [Physcomitrella patens]